MKNLLVFISPEKKLTQECELLAKIQIDNSISLGLQDDLVLITNFPYEYNGVKAIIVSDDNYCAFRPRSIKTSIVPYLIKQGIMKDGEIYWNHDFDAYQNEPMNTRELEMENIDAAFTTYGWHRKWCLGSDFIKTSAKDIFEKLRDIIFTDVEDEHALYELTGVNNNNINTRIKKLNITYQIGMRHTDYNYKWATKPLKVLHFHPHKPNLLNIFMYGRNPMGVPLMSERLIKVFNQHGIE